MSFFRDLRLASPASVAELGFVRRSSHVMKANALQIGLLFLATTALAGGLDLSIPGLPPGSDDPILDLSVAQRLAITRHLHVRLPAKTPFDADPEARLEYRRGYRKGYRFGMARFYNTIISSANDAFCTGFYAGRDDGTLMLSKGYAAPSASN